MWPVLNASLLAAAQANMGTFCKDEYKTRNVFWTLLMFGINRLALGSDPGFRVLQQGLGFRVVSFQPQNFLL
jgi:hypothetical protein